MKKLLIYISLLLILTCAKEDSQAPNTPPTQIVKQYTLTASAGDGGSVEGQGVYNEGTKVTIEAVPNNCFTFTGWSDGDIKNPRTIILDNDLNLNANFESITNEVDYSLVKLRYPCAFVATNPKSYNETERYKVANSGWLSVSVLEQYEGYYYPTNNDYNPPGFYSMDPHNFAHGDFNNDGLVDLVITWATFTHTLERNSRYNYSILINNGDGSMTYDHDAITTSSAHYNHFAYRTKVADFNGDGLDDIVSASMGVVQRLPGQASYTRWERIPLLINLGDGKFYDASTNIEGQEDGISPPEGHSFGHEIDVGDVDGDGDIDIYTGKILLINDGSGNFSNKTNLLPKELKPNRNLWSSVIADFNNDGIDDFFVPYAEVDEWSQYPTKSGVYALSNGNKPSYSDYSDIGFVEEAKYGLSNSKFNYAIDYDINLDGYKDIIIAVTRKDPYYVGKGLQVFLNVEDPITDNRKFIPGDYLLPDESLIDQYHGEGQLSVIDINNDGIPDIAHTSGAYGYEYGLSFYINNGGSLTLMNENDFAYMSQEQIPGRENYGIGNKLRRAIPINLNDSGWIDYISVITFSLNSGRNENIFYSVLSKD